MSEKTPNAGMFAQLDKILSSSDLKDVTSENVGFQELPEGYYLCEVEKAELTSSKKSGNPMVAFTMKVVEDGFTAVIEDNGSVNLTSIDKSKNKKIFIYYVFKDEQSVKRFAADMLKFEGEVVGEPILSKEYFMSSELLADALDILVDANIYVQITKNENSDGTSSTWNNMISWKRAAALELPVD